MGIQNVSKIRPEIMTVSCLTKYSVSNREFLVMFNITLHSHLVYWYQVKLYVLKIMITLKEGGAT
jgi:hypothetical protein